MTQRKPRMKKSREKRSARKRKDRLLTTEENTIRDAEDNFGRGDPKEKESTRLRATKESTSRDTEWEE